MTQSWLLHSIDENIAIENVSDTKDDNVDDENASRLFTFIFVLLLFYSIQW